MRKGRKKMAQDDVDAGQRKDGCWILATNGDGARRSIGCRTLLGDVHYDGLRGGHRVGVDNGLELVVHALQLPRGGA